MVGIEISLGQGSKAPGSNAPNQEDEWKGVVERWVRPSKTSRTSTLSQDAGKITTVLVNTAAGRLGMWSPKQVDVKRDITDSYLHTHREQRTPNAYSTFNPFCPQFQNGDRDQGIRCQTG